MKRVEWAEVGTLAEDSGSIGGDIQVGPSYSRRFVFGPVEGRYVVITDYVYPTRVDVHEDDSRYGTYGWDDYTEVLMCTDPEQPGDTAVDEHVMYGPGGALCYEQLSNATEAARQQAERMGPHVYEYYDPTEELKAGCFTRKD